jgi:hypothetical protein
MRRLALNKNGELTWCIASPDNFGKGRCNHVDHQMDGESRTEFVNRIAAKKNPLEADRIESSHVNLRSYGWLKLNYPAQVERAEFNFRNYYNHVKNMEWKISLMVQDEIGYLDADGKREFNDRVFAMESKRVELHDKCLSSVKEMNDLCKRLDLDPLVTGNVGTENRDNVAKALFDFCELKGASNIKFLDDLEM